jgi:hypothetical protein
MAATLVGAAMVVAVVPHDHRFWSGIVCGSPAQSRQGQWALTIFEAD